MTRVTGSRVALAALTLLSALFFPWPATALLALAGAYFEPLLPLAAGIFLDALYYAHGSGVPLATLLGALATALAYLVRSRTRA